VSRLVVRALTGWRTGLSGHVLVLQAGSAVNYFGHGLIVPFEIIYLHQARGFPTATAGLVLPAALGTAAVGAPDTAAAGRALAGSSSSPAQIWALTI
jgi:hypothetical protein